MNTQSEALRLAGALEGGTYLLSAERNATAAELRRLHRENEALSARVQELGELARNNNSRRVVELEAQLEAIGAGGVEPLRRRGCLHHIEEPRGMVSP